MLETIPELESRRVEVEEGTIFVSFGGMAGSLLDSESWIGISGMAHEVSFRVMSDGEVQLGEWFDADPFSDDVSGWQRWVGYQTTPLNKAVYCLGNTREVSYGRLFGVTTHEWLFGEDKGLPAIRAEFPGARVLYLTAEGVFVEGAKSLVTKCDNDDSVGCVEIHVQADFPW
ncbi:MAG: hypothetical protein WC764_00880 [Candidatus Paceibacterota bacterium]